MRTFGESLLWGRLIGMENGAACDVKWRVVKMLLWLTKMSLWLTRSEDGCLVCEVLWYIMNKVQVGS